MDSNIKSSEKISLAEAWRQFFGRFGNSKLIDASKSRPLSSVMRELVMDPDTLETIAIPVDGPEYADGVLDYYQINLATKQFAHQVCIPLKSSTYCRTNHNEYEPIEFRNWFAECETRFFDKYLFTPSSPIRDGNPESWDAMRIGENIPDYIFFDREAFEALDIWSIEQALGAKIALATNEPPATPHSELGIRKKLSKAGKRSGESRRADRKWVPHTKELIFEIIGDTPTIPREKLAAEVSCRWKDTSPEPSQKTITNFIKDMESDGTIQHPLVRRKTIQ